MYEKIGDKLCGVAKFVGGLGLVIAAIGALILLAALSEGEELLIVAIATIVGGGSMIISSWPLYAFGQITNDIHAMREKYDRQ